VFTEGKTQRRQAERRVAKATADLPVSQHFSGNRNTAIPASTMRIQIVLLALVLLSHGRTGAVAEEPPEEWIRKLQGDKPSEFRIAQVYLSRPGSMPWGKLDELAKTGDERVRQRLKEVVALMLLNGVDPRDVRQRRHLNATPAAEFAKARELAGKLTKAVQKAERDHADAAEGVQWYLLDEDAASVASELFSLHGWAVPALLELAEGQSPFLRLVAVDAIVVSQGGRLPAATLERLQQDQTRVVRFHGDSSEESTIAREVGALSKQYRWDAADQNALRDWHRSLALLHGFQGVKSLDDTVLTSFDPEWSFDEYWQAARAEMERRWDSRSPR
jgi:hypothetical protein